MQARRVETTKVLTALPVFNEERFIEPVLRQVCCFAHDVLVVDDGSVDRTAEILSALQQEQFGGRPGKEKEHWRAKNNASEEFWKANARATLKVVRHSCNLGYGAALKTAFDFAVAYGYDVLVTVDCDGQHEPSLIPEIVDFLLNCPGGPADIVSGSRYLKNFPGNSRPPEDRRRINRFVTNLLNQKLGLSLTDAFCGFKAYRVEILSAFKITEPGYGMPLQLWVQAARLGLKIVEFPVPLVYLSEERSFGGAMDDARQRLSYYLTVLNTELARNSFATEDLLLEAFSEG